MKRSFALRDLIPSRTTALDVGSVAVFVAIALYSFRSSFGGFAFWIVGVIALLIGIGLAYVATRLRWGLVLTAIVVVVVFGLVGSWLALRHYTLLGFVPTPRSLFETYSSSVTGWKELLTTAPPVGVSGDLMIIPVFCGYTAGAIACLIDLRSRVSWPVVLCPLVVLALGIATGTNVPVAPTVEGIVLGVAMIGWLAWRAARSRELVSSSSGQRRTALSAAALLAVVGLGGYFLAPALRGHSGQRAIWRQTVTPPFDPRVYPSPLAGYREYVKLGYDEAGDPNPDEVMFTIEGLPAGLPIRLATMDSYDGLFWQVSGGDPDDPSLNDSGSFERIGTRLQPETPGETAEVIVTIDEYSDVWVPDVGEVISIRFEGSEGGPARDRELSESFRYNRSTDTGATPLGLRKGDRYVMEVRLPVVVDTMEGKEIVPVVSRLGSTRSVAAIPQKLGSADVLAISDTGQRLDEIADVMITTGTYSDGDRQANQQLAKAGHSEARLVEFVQDYPTRPFVGNAEQYASAYALLFRDLDNLPTRIVMGFLPRDAPESGPIQVHQTEVEAWVEVPVADEGWVAIFPTPPRDQLSSSSTAPQQPDPDYKTQNPPPPPILDPEFDQPATAAGEAEAADETEGREDDRPADQPSPFANQTVRTVAKVATPLLLILAVLVFIVGLKWFRRRRRRRNGDPGRRIASGWREVTDLSTDLGRPVPSKNTRREAGRVVGTSATALAERTDATVWGGEQLSDEDVDAYWVALSSTLRDMKSEAGIGRRVRAAVSIQSLKTSARRAANGGRKNG